MRMIEVLKGLALQLQGFDNADLPRVVLVAGGSGVTFTLSTFLGVLSHVQNKKSKCRRIVWIWSIREPGALMRSRVSFEDVDAILLRSYRVGVESTQQSS